MCFLKPLPGIEADGLANFDNLLEGICPNVECAAPLMVHAHSLTILSRFLLVPPGLIHIGLPGENKFASCPRGHGCWRREGYLVWELESACHNRIPPSPKEEIERS